MPIPWVFPLLSLLTSPGLGYGSSEYLFPIPLLASKLAAGIEPVDFVAVLIQELMGDFEILRSTPAAALWSTLSSNYSHFHSSSSSACRPCSVSSSSHRSMCRSLVFWKGDCASCLCHWRMGLLWS